MPVPNIVEEVDLVLAREERRTNRVHRRVTPALVVKPALLVEVVKELGVALATPEVEVADLEVRPD